MLQKTLTFLFVLGTSALFAQQAGSLDTTFGDNGKAIIDFTGQTNKATAIALQPDGKIVVAGSSFHGTHYDFYAVRYNANGTLDFTFDNDGVAFVDFFGYADMCNAIAIQPDGKILLAGNAVTSATIAGNYVAVARLNADGSPDTTFGPDANGKVKFFNFDSSISALALQSDGKIIMGGVYLGDPMVMRINDNGTIDNTFSLNGYDAQDGISNLSNTVRKLIVQPDGKILSCSGAGDTNTPIGAIFRYNTNGTLDTAFSGDGKIVQSNTNANDMALLEDGRIVSVGTDSDFKMRIRRLTPEGNNDTTFGTTGVVTQAALPNVTQAYGLAVQADGKYMVVGCTHSGGSTSLMLYRFNFNGTTDGGFGTSLVVNGATVQNFGTDSSQANDVVIQPDGKILITGFQFTTGNGADWLTARFNPECETPVATPTGPSVQNFCGTTPISGINVTGTNVQWYAFATGGNPLSPTANLVSGSTYYGEATSGICTSPERLAVAVTVTNIATGTSFASGTITCIEADAGTTYQWKNCTTNEIIPNQTGQSFTPTQTGSYAAIVSQNNCSITTNCRNVNVLATELFDKVDFVIWPNPVNGAMLHVSGMKGEMAYRIVNMLGQQISSGKVNKEMIAVGQLAAGTYILELATENGKAVKRFLKN